MYNQNASEEAIGATLTLTIESIYLYTYIPTTRGVRDRIYIEQTSTYIVLFFWTRGIIRDIMNLQNLSSSCLYFIGILLKLTTGKTRCLDYLCLMCSLCAQKPCVWDCHLCTLTVVFTKERAKCQPFFIPLFYFPLISPKRDRDRFVPLKDFSLFSCFVTF